MAGMNPPMAGTSAGRRISRAAIRAPRLLMSWEDWLTLVAVFIAFVSVAVSIQQARWVRDMPAVVPTAVIALVVGLFAARLRVNAVLIQPLVLVIGAVVVVLAAQSYADGVTLNDRLADFRFRMVEWWNIVWAGDISNDNLPFVALVQAVTFLFCYLAAWSIYRLRNPWLAIIPAGFVLLSNISFQKGQPAGAFVTYLFGSLLLVSRLHLQANQDRWRRDHVDYPDWVSLNTLNMTVALVATLVIGAWLIPLGTQAAAVERVVDSLIQPAQGQTDHFFRLFHNVDSRRGARLHTFGDTLPIQGEITLGTKILLEVKSGEGGLVRATSYDAYTGRGWKVTDRDRNRVEGGEVAPSEDTSGGYEARAVSVLNVRVIDRESIVVTAGTPLGSNLPTYVESPESFAGDIERVQSRRALDENDSYNSIGSTSRATADQLRSAGTDYPEWVTARYLQVPDGLPERVADESRRIAGQAPTPYDQAVAIEQYLRQLPYDLAVQSPPAGRDAVDFLLFDLKRGYFDYQATAMSVMLRTLGVPARIAVGYVLDPTEEEETKYIVRKDDAYTWVEVFFPRFGWVNFNPTQDRPAGGAGGIGSFGSLDGRGFVEPEDLSGLFEDTFGLTDDVGDALAEPPIIQDRGGAFPWPLAIVALSALALLAVGALSSRLAWNWGLSGLDSRSAMWEKVQRLARFTGFRSRPHETPMEWSSRLGAGVGREPEAAQLAQAYEEARYGRPDLERADPEETRQSYQALRNALAGLLLRRGQKQEK